MTAARLTPDSPTTTAGPARRLGFRFRSVVLGLAVTLTAGLTTGAGTASAEVTVPAPPAGTSYPEISTLGTSPFKAAEESAAGMKTAMMEISWRNWEPQNGVFNATYENEMKWRLAQLRASGMKVTLGLGLHFTPEWVRSMPNGRLVDQNGKVSNEANFIYNDKVRSEGWQFLQRVAKVLDMSQIDAIRITSGGRAELIYPEGTTYWAFDANAQNGDDLPRTVGPNPYPGWKPGTPGLQPAQTQQWALWYVDALADVGEWQMRAMRKLNFTGTFEIMTPGVGVYARKLDVLARQNLPASPLAVGALWDRIYFDMYHADKKIAANVSSMADGSGGNDSCTPADKNVPLTDMAVTTWGGARWISRIADEYGIPKVGENPGFSEPKRGIYSSRNQDGYMATTMRQGATCGFSTVYWAHDNQFWNGTLDFATWAAYARA